MTEGRCWLRLGDQTHELKPGHVVMLPHGNAHALLHSPESPAILAPQLLAEGREDANGPVYGGEGEPTTLICGHFTLDRASAHPLFADLPDLLQLTSEEGSGAAWIGTATELAAAESKAGEVGSTAFVDRIAELLLIQLLRASLKAGALSDTFMAALADPELQSSLAGR